MKKTIRAIIPFILILAILICSGWYLLVYDRAFTRDMLVKTARYFENNENHSVAIWFYDLAYRQSSDNDAVAIELAEQYKAAGNYTKAEYTLSRAIADGGSVDLYIALCKTFVEQDKLLDAVNMLNNVTNPEIKAQLEVLRPAAPTCDPDPNVSGSYYVQYITVHLSAATGTIYANSHGQMPSIKSDQYKEGIVLEDGENTIYTIAVSENGLVSPAAVYRFTVGGVVEQVTFADPAVESAIRDKLAVSSGKVLYTNDLWTIKDFTVPSDAKKLDDLRHMIALEQLTINNVPSGQLTFLAGLAKLSELCINGTDISSDELSIIGRLPELKKLTLSNCGLASAAGLKDAISLTYLDLSSNSLRDIAALANLSKLQELYLQNNAINDLSAIASLKSLTRLNVSFNSLFSMAPISSLTGLKWLEATANSLTDISFCNRLSALEHLTLSYNAISNVAPLAGCTTLKYLNISNNTVKNISALSALNNLTTLDFSHNMVTELPQWNTDAALVKIYGSYNQLTTLEPLKGLSHLNNVFMNYNTEISSVNELATCPVLIQVDVYGTKVKDASALTAQSIIVNYNPIQN